ncbi:tail component Z [Proteus phage P2-71]|nr:tail component Z [Proteus phage P2-71]
MAISVETVGVNALKLYFDGMPKMTARSMRLAINTVVRRSGMKALRDGMLAEISFPRGYLKGDRLRVARYASDNKLEATILARKRATSLARFATSGTMGKSGVTVKVRRGRTTFLKKAFLVKLKAGASMSEDNYNTGLAVRLSPGEKLNNKASAHKAWLVPGRVALLYAPSVNQVMETTAGKVSPQIAKLVEGEFFRQFERLSNGK